MKKFIIFILMFFTIPTISVFAVTETIIYDVTIYEDKAYDLLTGEFKDMPSYASTNRLLVNSEQIDFSSDTFHHVLYWDKNNNYIGYSNSQYSNLQLITYIPAAINNYITMPLNTKFVAFMVSSGVEVPIPALNDHTLEEVFGQGNLLDSEQLVTNGDFSDGTTGWTGTSVSLSVVTENLEVTINIPSQNHHVYKTFVVGTDKYYLVSNINYTHGVNMAIGFSISNRTILSANIGSYNLYSTILTGNNESEILIFHDTASYTSGDKYYVDYIYAFNISTLIANKQYSPMFNTTFDLMTDANIKTQMDLWVQNPQYWLDYDALGFELIQSQLEIYYNSYVTTLANYPYALSASSLELMTISYDRDEVTLPIEDIDVKIENYLTDLNVNTPFAKTLLAISMIIIAVVALALLKTPKYVYIGAGVMVYLFFTLLGWFPVWILVMLGILVIGILIISFKGDGGGSSD